MMILMPVTLDNKKRRAAWRRKRQDGGGDGWQPRDGSAWLTEETWTWTHTCSNRPKVFTFTLNTFTPRRDKWYWWCCWAAPCRDIVISRAKTLISIGIDGENIGMLCDSGACRSMVNLCRTCSVLRLCVIYFKTASGQICKEFICTAQGYRQVFRNECSFVLSYRCPVNLLRRGLMPKLGIAVVPSPGGMHAVRFMKSDMFVLPWRMVQEFTSCKSAHISLLWLSECFFLSQCIQKVNSVLPFSLRERNTPTPQYHKVIVKAQTSFHKQCQLISPSSHPP